MARTVRRNTPNPRAAGRLPGPIDRDSFKEVAASVIEKHLDKHQMTQTEAGYVVREQPSQLSLIIGRRFDGFSQPRLERMLTRLGYDVETIIRPAKGRTGKVVHTDRSGLR